MPRKQFRYQKNKSFVAKTLQSTKKTKKQSFAVLSCQTTQCPKTSFCLVVLVPSSVLAPKLCFFWDPSWFWEHFGAKPCQNPLRYQKKQSFGAKTLEGKKKKNKVLEHWVVWQLKAPKLWFSCFFGTLPRFGTKTLFLLGPLKVLGAFWSITLPKPWRVPKKQSFVAKTLQSTKKTKKQSFGVLSCQTTRCSKTMFFIGFFGTPRFGTKTLLLLGPLKVLGAFWSITLPKPWRVPKKAKFWCQNAGGSQKNKNNKVLEF